MNDVLRDRILRKLGALPDERVYQVLDYIEFLESKYATQTAPAPNVFQRFAEGVEDSLRAGRVSASNIAETMNLMSKAMNALSGVAAAGKSVASDVKSVATEVVSAAAKQAGRVAGGGGAADGARGTTRSRAPGGTSDSGTAADSGAPDAPVDATLAGSTSVPAPDGDDEP
ncbi:MAG TPA: hypothetical protein VFK13_01975 [Gemmatimonadaceae bacterium]|nr:hypothetical protein [Gemmatimonadaceae bacterium]